MSAEISIHPVNTPELQKQFLDFPYELYRNDENWRAPLRMERADQINPDKNPGMKGLEVQFFLAKKDSKTVGRIAAIKNNNHLELYKDQTGHFGYLDTETDPAIVQALLAAAEDWLAARGLKRIVGPLNFSTNEELGQPVSGFDTPPMLMMPYGRPETQEYVEACGYEKEIDLEAYITHIPDSYPHPDIVQKMVNIVEADPSVTIRHMDKKNFMHEVQTAMTVFNDAWSDNWGFVPFTDEQITHIANDLKPVIVEEFFWVVEVEGKPAAFALMVPNVNEAAHGLDGKIFPFGWLKLLYRLKIKQVKSGRILLMGVRQEYHKTKLGLAMAAALSANIFKQALDRGYHNVEMSWILESNKSMIRIIKLGQGKLYKTYRIFRKNLD